MSEDLDLRINDLRRTGRLWKAREVLRGRIGSTPFSEHLYRLNGQLLLELGEHLEAGKFLLLAGSDEPEHQACIRLFQHRFRHTQPAQVLSLFPRNARFQQLSLYPPRAQQYLRELGLPDDLQQAILGISHGSTVRDKLVIAGCLITLLILACLCIIGLITVIRYFLAA